ncbi:ATP-binding protein [Lamprobacter modestohalophilus]|uniref:ATP-binding protein n=1 Tax=Lamprobacter modestohalophilus TaxID=1064514 RepID=UPI002ADEF485|nr:ATP-binding protein [Lamprobacter modestohalophilus]MEA1049286.1 ATP-binding protein [Lamprobacter modestohalophilus]
MRLRPGSLFARVLLTLLLSFGSFALITFGSMVYYVLYPVVQRSTADLAAFMELSARTLLLLPSQARDDYQAKLLDEYQVRLLSGSEPPQNLDDYFYPYVVRLSQALSLRLDRPVRMQSNLIDGRRWFWIDLETSSGRVWAGIPRDRIGTRPMIGVVVICALAVLLVVLTAAILARRVTAPLTRLSQAAEEVAKGRSPEPLAETGPRELANLARQFNETSQQVRELLADRTVLLSGISHDLRTPLTRLRLALEMLPDDTDTELRARMRRDIEEMSAQIGQAVELGGTLGAGARDQEDLAKLVSEVVGHRPRILWRPLGRCIHSVNALALRRILGNLIENALRYSNDTVEVRLDCRHETPALFVLDRGPGIPDAEREAVFRPFYRLERSRNRNTGGSGLGLAVARQLAVANEMEIALSDRDGGGLIASIRLPAARAGDDTELVH